MADIPKFKLNTGAEIPSVGLGTYEAHGEDVYEAVKEALKIGYRHIDAAMIYKNEEQVGRGIKDSGIPREEIFVTSKLWLTQFHDPAKALDESLKRLGLDYVDLFLVHWPIARKPDPKDYYAFGLGNDDSIDYIQVWEKVQELPKEKTRAVGVSNFTIEKLEKLLAAPTTKVVPAANQVELHPKLPQQRLVDYAKSKGIVTEAYSPLAQGKVNNPVVEKIAQKYGVDVGQIALSWNVQRGVVVLPKSVTASRIKSNITLVKLDEDDFKALAELGETPDRVVWPKFDEIDVFNDNADSKPSN